MSENKDVVVVQQSETVMSDLVSIAGPEVAEKFKAIMDEAMNEMQKLTSREKLLLIIKLSRELAQDSVEPVKTAGKKAVGTTAVVSGKAMQRAGSAIIKVGEVVRDAGKNTETWGLALSIPDDLINEAVEA